MPQTGALDVAHPELPIEVWERVIDVHTEFGTKSCNATVQSSLRVWILVCRAWVPRCRLYLYNEVHITSRENLLAVSKFFHSFPCHAHRVSRLKIVGGGSNQSWISEFPLRLPNLPNLTYLTFKEVDLAQQHPWFPQLLSLLKRCASGTIAFFLYFEDPRHEFDQHTMQIRAVVNAPDCVYSLDRPYKICSSADIARMSMHPCLTSLMNFIVDGDHGFLADLLPTLRFPAQNIGIRIRSSSHCDTACDAARQKLVVWKAISRIFENSSSANVWVYSNEEIDPVYNKMAITGARTLYPMSMIESSPEFDALS